MRTSQAPLCQGSISARDLGMWVFCFPCPTFISTCPSGKLARTDGTVCYITCAEKKCAEELCAKGLLVWVNMNSHLSHRENNLSRTSNSIFFAPCNVPINPPINWSLFGTCARFWLKQIEVVYFFISFHFSNFTTRTNSRIWFELCKGSSSFILSKEINQCLAAVAHHEMSLAVLSFHDKCSFCRWTNHVLCWVLHNHSFNSFVSY